MTSDLYVAGEIDQDQVNLALDIENGNQLKVVVGARTEEEWIEEIEEVLAGEK